MWIAQGSVLEAIYGVSCTFTIYRKLFVNTMQSIKAMPMTPRYMYIVTEMIYQSRQRYANCKNVYADV